MKKCLCLLLSLIFALSCIACSSESDSPSETSSVFDIEELSKSIEEDLVMDYTLSEYGEKIKEIVETEFESIEACETHEKSDPSYHSLDILITVDSITDKTPYTYFKIAEKAFTSEAFAESDYSSIGFTISSSEEMLSLLSIYKTTTSGKWASTSEVFKSKYKTEFESAYNENTLFSDLDLMSQFERKLENFTSSWSEKYLK